jgi:hypothetical protein
MPGRTATAQPVTPAPLVTNLHHHAALATHGSGGTSNGAQMCPSTTKTLTATRRLTSVPSRFMNWALSPHGRFGTSARPGLPRPDGSRSAEISVSGLPRRCSHTPRFRYGAGARHQVGYGRPTSARCWRLGHRRGGVLPGCPAGTRTGGVMTAITEYRAPRLTAACRGHVRTDLRPGEDS